MPNVHLENKTSFVRSLVLFLPSLRLLFNSLSLAGKLSHLSHKRSTDDSVSSISVHNKRDLIATDARKLQGQTIPTVKTTFSQVLITELKRLETDVVLVANCCEKLSVLSEEFRCLCGRIRTGNVYFTFFHRLSLPHISFYDFIIILHFRRVQ